MAGSYYDVFISYARADAPEWVRTLAETLHRKGFEAFWDGWEIGPGDVLVHELDRGLLASRNGVLVVTKSAFARPFVRAEYAAMMTRAIEGRQRLIPVLLDDVELPPLLASRVWIDFRGADGPEYEHKVDELARALRGEKLQRPARDGETAPPPGTGFRAEGILRRTLRIAPDRVALLEGGEVIAEHAPKPLDHALEQTLWTLRRARRRRIPEGSHVHRRGQVEVAAEPAAPLQEASLAAGAALARTFLDGAAGGALREVVTQAEGQNAPLELGLEIERGTLRALPWETLRLPAKVSDQRASDRGAAGPSAGSAATTPLALHPRVRLHRVHPADGPAPGIQIPGPLRILVAIGSPEALNRRGELLDYERELSQILDAVGTARRAKAHVLILHRGTVRAIREALETERYHVLHLSCHAGPGVLLLETDDGEEDRVSAERFWQEALPDGRGVPLVVLAGCATALDVRRSRSEEGTGDAEVESADEKESPAGSAEGEELLPGLAAQLLDHGVPAVLAMQAPVSDPYATQLATHLYRGLATHQEPAPLAVLAAARRATERWRLEQEAASPKHQLAEWATPALYLRGTPQRLYDPAGSFGEIQEAPEARFAPGVVVRTVGDFVGRRREERLVLQTLRGAKKAGVLLRGMGGVGKSTLAAEVLTRLVEEGRLVVSLTGEVAPETVIEQVGKDLLGVAHAQKAPEDHPLRQLATVLQRPDLDWTGRFELLDRAALGQLPLVLLLDNFESNLHDPDEEGVWSLENPQLAALLVRWLTNPGKSRLAFTSRHPFTLSDQAHRRLEDHHLGPLTPAETRKLLWRLDALDALGAEDQQRAYEAVGGHPRALEYLDALLRGGEAKFDDVTLRLEKNLKSEGVDRPDAWIKDRVAGDLDRALAETVTAASADVLLEDLLRLVDRDPLARKLLLGASVYRVPVDQIALAWQVSEELENPEDPAWIELNRQVNQRTRERQEQREQVSADNPLERLGFSPEEIQAYVEGFRRHTAPPLRMPDGIADAYDLLERLGLLTPVLVGDTALYQVHRWTATALEEEAVPQALTEAHHRAARHWRWREDRIPQSRQDDVDQLLEARHHHHAAGEIDEAVEVTESICSQLDTWGAYGREEQLCREVLTWVPERSQKAAAFQHQLGLVAQKRGSYDEALAWYRQSLAIEEELGNRSGMASSYHQLGRVAEARGSYDEALDWYRQSLAISEELGDRSGMAISHHQLGMVAQKRGSYDEALDWYRQSLAISEELGDRSGMASSYHQLGRVAEERGSYDEALAWYRQSLAISEALGDRLGMASSYHQLGMVAQKRGSYDEALDWYRQSLAIKEELGNRSGMASSLSQLGVLLTETGEPARAVPWTLRSLALRLEIGVPEIRIDLHWLTRQREALGEERFAEIVREHLDEEASESLFRMLAEFAEGEEEKAP